MENPKRQSVQITVGYVQKVKMSEKFVFYCLMLVIVGIFLDPDATWHYLDHAKDSITNHFYNFQSIRSFYHQLFKLFHHSLGEYEFSDSFEWGDNSNKFYNGGITDFFEGGTTKWSYEYPNTNRPDATNEVNIFECSEEVTNVDVF